MVALQCIQKPPAPLTSTPTTYYSYKEGKDSVHSTPKEQYQNAYFALMNSDSKNDSFEKSNQDQSKQSSPIDIPSPPPHLLDNLGVIVTNHHLYWNPPARYEKLRQCYVMMETAIDFRKTIQDGKGGDFQGIRPLDVGTRRWPIFINGGILNSLTPLKRI